MKQRLLQTVARSARLKILNELKRTQGLSVGDLAERLHMSYMGVKDLCIQMERSGLLDTWRKPQTSRGRPFKLYRLTQRSHELFPTASNSATLDILEAAQRLFGPSAPEKLLLVFFQKMTAGYEERLRDGTLPERVKWLARLRDHDGYMSEAAGPGVDEDSAGENDAFSSPSPASAALRIVEHHSPIADLLRAFPVVARMEAEMFQRILKTSVRREEDSTGGQFRAEFIVGA